jgi:hypothetical protein
VQIKYMYCFLLHIFISLNPRTTHQASQSQFFWPLRCLFFFDMRILITPLVSSNSSLNSNHILSSTKGSNKCSQFRNFVYKFMTLYSCLLPLSEFFFNLILYSIFDHLTFGGWGILLLVKKKPRI